MTWIREAKSRTFSWFERVPSKSNLADGPSRLDFEEVTGMGCKLVDPLFPKVWGTKVDILDL